MKNSYEIISDVVGVYSKSFFSGFKESESAKDSLKEYCKCIDLFLREHEAEYINVEVNENTGDIIIGIGFFDLHIDKEYSDLFGAIICAANALHISADLVEDVVVLELQIDGIWVSE